MAYKSLVYYKLKYLSFEIRYPGLNLETTHYPFNYLQAPNQITTNSFFSYLGNKRHLKKKIQWDSLFWAPSTVLNKLKKGKLLLFHNPYKSWEYKP